jgi:L-asparaginase II
MRWHLEVVLWRGEIAESRHQVQAVACDVNGRRLAFTEAPERVTTFRSAAKPFQLTPLVERGHAERLGFGPAHLALMAASHTGSARHVAVAREILQRVGRTERDLACGIEDPIDAESLRAVRSGAEPASALFHNCSGKHAGMIALCVSEGWPVEGYQRPEHPLQKLMHRTVAEICGVPTEQVPIAIDGCSVCVFAMPLAAMARGFARLAGASVSGDARERALATIRDAMRANPWAVGGVGRLSTALMEAAPHLVSKGGAEGLECVGWPERNLGVAIRCEDGAQRALGPAVCAVLEQLGALDAEAARKLASWARPQVRNAAGLEVGSVRAELKVLAAAER